MIIDKTLHRYILRNFIRVFSITFFVSLFVLLMQFMFRYADDFIGKGVGFVAMAQFFFYAALSLIPLSLPLSILLGSLMTFGNFGERLELLSMKAAGISLFRIMSSLIIFIALLSIGSFYFADNILPKTQVDMWTLVFSIREKSPELQIPEGSFCSDIDGMNIYVKDKHSNGRLNDVIIYDYSNGFENTGIILAKEGSLEMSQDKKYLMLTLYNGESFENLNQGPQSRVTSDIIPYRRESFSKKEVIIDYDANFNEINGDYLNDDYVSKNTTQLQHTIDSVSHRVDSIKQRNVEKTINQTYFDYTNVHLATKNADQIASQKSVHSIYAGLDSLAKKNVIENAIIRCNNVSNDIDYDMSITNWLEGEIRRHAIEWHKRYTLAFACFIFLFIGAPLGAIIRKGGMGMPIVLATVIFIIYYIIDNAGYKMAREGIWPAWQGMWLSASILLPFGILLTYLAATDNTIMNAEAVWITIKEFFKTIKTKCTNLTLLKKQ
ncbi:MAG: LptF/LptG family permease [Paludibacteraceae bacterium]|nr:LptF/LptG family permease [Paludibacteraceae bacterium]